MSGSSARTLSGKSAQLAPEAPGFVARFTPSRVEKLLTNDGIVRNRLKVESTVGTARAFLAVQKEFGSFDAFVFVWKVGTEALRPLAGEPI